MPDNDYHYPTKPLPWRTIEVTSLVVSFTTMYVHIFAFDLVRAQMYALNSVLKDISLTQRSGASCWRTQYKNHLAWTL